MKLELPKLRRPNLRREGGGRSSLQAPPFLADLFYDLRDRRLLPVVALVLVSIAAVPLLLGDDAETSHPPAALSGGGASTDPEGESNLIVVEANPGLRDYRKRLKGRTPADPFASRGATDGDGGEGSEGTETASKAPAGSSAASSPSPEPPSEGEGDAPAKPVAPESPPSSDVGSDDDDGSSDDLDGKRLYGFRPDVRFGVAGSGKLTLHEDLPLGSLLPKENGIVLLTGVVQSGKRVLFNVAPGIVVRGDGGCVGGDANCRFLSMREGDAVDLLTGMPGEAFRLVVESIEFVELPLPPKSERASGSSAAQPRQGLARGIPQNFSN